MTAGLADVVAAEAAITTFLAAADGDDDPDTTTDEAAVATALSTAIDTDTNALVAGDYLEATSVGVRAALLADQETADALTLTNANTDVTEANTAIVAVTGLTAAAAAEAAAVIVEGSEKAAWVFASDAVVGLDTSTDTAGELFITVNELEAGATGTSTPFAEDEILTLTEVSASGVVTMTADVIVGGVVVVTPTAAQTAYVVAQQALAADYVAAINANVAAAASSAAAVIAEAAALLTVSNSGTAATAAAAAVGALAADYVLDASAPTVLEIAAADAIFTGRDALATAIAAADFDTNETVTEAAHAALTDTAVTAGFITAAEKALMDAAYDGENTIIDTATATAAEVASLAVLDSDLNGWDAANVTYDAAVLVNTNLLTDLNNAVDAVDAAQLTIDTLAEAVTAMDAAQATVDALAALNETLTDAETAITDAGYATPVTLTAGATAATIADDVFLTDDAVATSNITSFGVVGNDALFIGTGLTLNADTTAAANGNDALLEVWLTETAGNTFVTVETAAFGSNSVADEYITIELTGIAFADVTLVDGLVTVA
ncbi:MAG: hypothetical protein MH219_20375 [Marinobacter sp.]|nr:hypothetical protein [Marinobacter sp.]MCL1481508.1 hypothetical protein [Marinobacter sp.]